MANKKIFASASSTVPSVNTTNLAGGRAYAMSTKGALAQMAVTGVFNDTFYADAKSQLAVMKKHIEGVDNEYLAKLALYTRERAYMKDMPAYLCALLAARDVTLLDKVFGRVINNGKMLRNFVQLVRSGATGRKSLGSRPKKLVAEWLNNANDTQLLSASVGNAPSLADVIRLSHPKAKDEQREAFFKHVLGRDVELDALPENVRALLQFRSGTSVQIPQVPFELLTTLPLSTADWKAIAKNASWTQTRMNLNTFLRHDVFASRDMVDLVAAKLADEALISKANVFPYQLLSAYLNVDSAMPVKIVNALQDAMEIAVANVPAFEHDVAVLVDTSGSMKDPVTGARGSATSKVRCIDVAALFASAVLRKNPSAEVVPFDTKAHKSALNGRDAIMTNAKKLASFGGGGTDCACALRELNARGSRAQTVIYVSDNESWVNAYHYGNATGVMAEWKKYLSRNPRAKLVCIDLTPNTTTQAQEGTRVLNVGGFSDEVFNIVALFDKGALTTEHWVGEIERVAL